MMNHTAANHTALSSSHRMAACLVFSLAVALVSSVVVMAATPAGKRAARANHSPSRKSASPSVASPPTISKFFFQDAVAQNGTFSVDFSIKNPNDSTDLTGISFADSLPAGLIVATPNGVTNGCGGTVTAVAGSSTITFTGGTLAASTSCDLLVMLQATGGPGSESNTTGAISANESGAGGTSNTETIQIVGPPSISKVFGASSMPLGGTTSLSFTLTNPNTSTTLQNLTFTDTLPAGLVVASAPALTGSCLESGGGDGVVQATGGGNTISLVTLTLVGGASCSFSADVTSTSSGLKSNTTSQFAGTFTAGENTLPISGNVASASTTVLSPPTISKSFANPGVPLGGTTTLNFTLTNPNSSTALTGVGFTDNFPAGLVVAGTPGAVDNCGGTFTPVAGATSVSLSGGTIAAGSSCTISVNVQVTTAGFKNNVTGPVTSTNGGTGTGSNTATVGGFDICIKDSTTGAMLQWSSTTGAYTFTNCKTGFTISGTGTTRTIGATQSLTDFKSDRRISGIFLSNQETGTAAVTVMIAQGVFQTFNLVQRVPNAACTCP